MEPGPSSYIEPKVVRAPFCITYLVGNSHLASYRGMNRGLYSLLHPNTMVDSLAIGGSKVDGAFTSMLVTATIRERDYPTLNRSHMIVMTGDNDLRRGDNPEKVVNDLMINLLRCLSRNKNLTVFVCGILKSPSLKRGEVERFNKRLETECSEKHPDHKGTLIYLDLETLVSGAKGIDFVPRQALFATDGVHLSPVGERLLCRIFASVLNPRIHEIFEGKAPKISGAIKSKTTDSTYLDYIRMKGIFRKSYSDIVDNLRIVRPFLEKERVQNANAFIDLRLGGVFTNPRCGFKVELKTEADKRKGKESVSFVNRGEKREGDPLKKVEKLRRLIKAINEHMEEILTDSETE